MVLGCDLREQETACAIAPGDKAVARIPTSDGQSASWPSSGTGTVRTVTSKSRKFSSSFFTPANGGLRVRQQRRHFQLHRQAGQYRVRKPNTSTGAGRFGSGLQRPRVFRPRQVSRQSSVLAFVAIVYSMAPRADAGRRVIPHRESATFYGTVFRFCDTFCMSCLISYLPGIDGNRYQARLTCAIIKVRSRICSREEERAADGSLKWLLRKVPPPHRARSHTQVWVARVANGNGTETTRPVSSHDAALLPQGSEKCMSACTG